MVQTSPFFFNGTATTEIYTRPYPLSLHDALPLSTRSRRRPRAPARSRRPGGSARSEEYTSELQSHGLISYAVFCLKKKKRRRRRKKKRKKIKKKKKKKKKRKK